MAPTFQAAGTVNASTGANITVTWPTHLAGDIGIMITETSGNSADLTPPAGWNAVPSTPVTDVATIAGSKLHVWWRRATSSAEGAVATGAATDHIISRIVTFRGCITTGNPGNVSTVGTKTTASTTATVPSVTTTVDDTLIVMIVGRPNDSASTTHFGVPVNANLTALAEHAEAGNASGNGGGFVVSSGVKDLAGSTGTSTLTKIASTTDTYVVFALRPPLNYPLDVTKGDFTFNGTTTGLLENSRIDATVGGFTYSGISTGLNLNLSLNSTTGAYSVVRNNSLLQQALLLSGTTRTFNAQAVNADISANRVLNQQVGSYLVNGVNVDLTYQQNLAATLDAIVGPFTLVGNPIQVNVQRTIVGQTQSYVVNGPPVGLLKSLAINAIPGTFTVAGNSVGLSFARTLDVTSGGFAVVGYNLGLNRAFQLSTSNGGFTVQGQDGSFNLAKLLDAQVGSFNIFNLPAEITKRYPLTANNATFVLNTPDIDYFADRNLKAVTGQLDIYVQDGSNLFTYLTNKPTILPKATPTRRNQWVYGRFTHMGRRFL